MSQAKDNVLIVAHDAGGAEILAHYVRQYGVNARFVLEGPAQKIFQRVLGGVECCTLQQGLAEADWCLCGTSWQSELEFSAIKQAKALSKPVVAFIDHWVNYKERFIRRGEQQLPDEIWVGDQYAENIAQQLFADIPVRWVENPYFKHIRRQISELEKHIQSDKGGATLLFVSENISGHAHLKYGDSHYFGYTEFDALQFLLEHLSYIHNGIDSVIIRPHPSDSPGKYQKIIEQNQGKVVLSTRDSLLEDICQADCVAGCETMALVIALLAGKRVYTCIPKPQQCRLPYPEIVSLWEQVNKKHSLNLKKD